MTVLEDEGQDGRAELRIVAELLQVAAVLSFRPHGHLDETHQSEKRHGKTLSHQREAQPRAQLFNIHKQRNEKNINLLGWSWLYEHADLSNILKIVYYVIKLCTIIGTYINDLNEQTRCSSLNLYSTYNIASLR